MYIIFTENDIGSRYHFYLPNKEQSKSVQNWETKNQTSDGTPYQQYHMMNTDPGSNSIPPIPLQYPFSWYLLKGQISHTLAVIVCGQGNSKMCFKYTSSFFHAYNTKRFVSSPSEQ